MVTAVSTIANGGAHVTPRVVKQIVYKNTGEVKDIEIKKEERVISEKTSKDVLSMMKSVVQEGTRKNAKVEGYSNKGKTGTSYGTVEIVELYKTSIQKFVSFQYTWPHIKAQKYQKTLENKNDKTETSIYFQLLSQCITIVTNKTNK